MTKENWSRQKKYYYKNKDKIAQRRKDYYQKNKDKLLQYGKEYYQHAKNYRQKHPEIYRALDRKRLDNLRKILQNLKSNGCAICGYHKCYRALHFHHSNPKDKKFQITIHSLKFNDKRVVDELNKCILLCSNCHSEITEREVGDYTNV